MKLSTQKKISSSLRNSSPAYENLRNAVSIISRYVKLPLAKIARLLFKIKNAYGIFILNTICQRLPTPKKQILLDLLKYWIYGELPASKFFTTISPDCRKSSKF
ncbi:hypothetical protein [Pricia antarctica]|uniref:hypothetical protein n=1 Tax=Pricia antarctica TaxID=641691 RepID=UPI0011136303|nr:hypothetical protein [Pricia antarctica]